MIPVISTSTHPLGACTFPAWIMKNVASTWICRVNGGSSPCSHDNKPADCRFFAAIIFGAIGSSLDQQQSNKKLLFWRRTVRKSLFRNHQKPIHKVYRSRIPCKYECEQIFQWFSKLFNRMATEMDMGTMDGALGPGEVGASPGSLGSSCSAASFSSQPTWRTPRSRDYQARLWTVEQCSKPLLVDDYRGLYYPVCWDYNNPIGESL